MKKTSSALALIALPLVLAALLYLSLGNFLLSPNSYGSPPGGDSIKNRYTFAYSIEHGELNLAQEAMHYPFVERSVYTDNQPILALFFGAIHKHIYPISGYSMGILNGLLLLSLFATALLFFLILRRKALPLAWAFVGSLSISLLSPQLLRWGAHYALGYTLLVPLSWYLLLRWNDAAKSKFRYPFAFGFLVFFFGAIHSYNALIAGIFLLAYGIVELLQTRGKAWRKFLLLSTSVGIALASLFALIKFGDPVSDRPAAPYGIYAYKSNFEGVFLAPHGAFREFWSSFLQINYPDFEGWVYVGFWGVFVLLATVLRFGKGLKRNYRLAGTLLLQSELNRALWAALLCLFFSFALPYSLSGELLLELLPPLKQFRSLGRFAWAFHAVFSVYIIYYIYLLYRSLRLRGMGSWAGAGLFVVCFFAVLDIWSYQKKLGQELHADNIFDGRARYRQLFDSLGLKAGEFQAILPLPFNNVGNEVFGRSRSPTAMYAGMQASFDLALPLMSYEQSRTSLRRGLYSLQLLSSPLVDKSDLQGAWPDMQRNILLLHRRQEQAPENELRWLRQAELLHQDEDLAYYRLSPQALFADSLDFHRQRLLFDSSLLQAQGSEGQELRFDKPSQASFILRSYEQEASAQSFAGQGAYTLPEPNAALLDTLVYADSSGQDFRIHCWIRPLADKNLPYWFAYKQWNAQGELVDSKDMLVDDALEAKGEWIACQLDFRLQASGNRCAFYFANSEWYIDELLLRPVQRNVYYRLPQSSTWLYNGYPLK